MNLLSVTAADKKCQAKDLDIASCICKFRLASGGPGRADTLTLDDVEVAVFFNPG